MPSKPADFSAGEFFNRALNWSQLIFFSWSSLVDRGHLGRLAMHLSNICWGGSQSGHPPNWLRLCPTMSVALILQCDCSPGVLGSQKCMGADDLGFSDSATVLFNLIPFIRLACIFFLALSLAADACFARRLSTSAIFSWKPGSPAGGSDPINFLISRSFRPCLLGPFGWVTWWCADDKEVNILSVLDWMSSSVKLLNNSVADVHQAVIGAIFLWKSSFSGSVNLLMWNLGGAFGGWCGTKGVLKEKSTGWWSADLSSVCMLVEVTGKFFMKSFEANIKSILDAELHALSREPGEFSFYTIELTKCVDELSTRGDYQVI